MDQAAPKPTAADIVKALADTPEPLQYATQRCALCNQHQLGGVDNHDPKCPWRMAREFDAAPMPAILSHPGATQGRLVPATPADDNANMQSAPRLEPVKPAWTPAPPAHK
jgi:hypothetical protein